MERQHVSAAYQALLICIMASPLKRELLLSSNGIDEGSGSRIEEEGR